LDALDTLTIQPLQEHHVADILSWRYPPPFDFYDPPSDPDVAEYTKEFLRPELMFHAILNSEDRLSGFCSYGEDGQVPGGNYTAEALDIGLGMRPSLTGKGRGGEFLDVILAFAVEAFEPELFRLTVAAFNERSTRLYLRFGFREDSRFTDTRFNVPYLVLTRNR
jgi:RimJ/RimL family protein N-acetyltransferase